MKTIGRYEKVDLKKLNLLGLKVKVDTGAYSPSLHCHEISINTAGTEVYVKLLDSNYEMYDGNLRTFKISKISEVKSSNGSVENRIFIKTTITMFNKDYEAEISLTDRSSMQFPMLLGRKFIQDKFLVDVSLEYQNR
jgi:hypothetical protein